MSGNLNNKNKMYEFEKMAIVIVVVMALIIVLLVSFGTCERNTDGDSTANDSRVVIDGTSDSSMPEKSEADDSSLTSVAPPTGNDTIDFKVVEVNNSMLQEGEMLFVNQDHKFTNDVSERLVNIYVEKTKLDKDFVLSYASLELDLDAFNALCLMLDGFYADTNIPLNTLMVSRAYVSAEDQQSSYDKESATAEKTELPYMQAGGQSEHQTGLALHLTVYPSSSGTMGEGPYEWFTDNCWKYGFALRYPEGKDDVTQARSDSTHFRYIGVPHAAIMHVNKWVLEDYIKYLQEKTDYENRATIKDAQGNGYEIYAVKAHDGDVTQINVPEDESKYTYSISGTNSGYYVVTLKSLNN